MPQSPKNKLEQLIQAKLPTSWGNFTLYAFEQHSDGKEHVGIGMGDIVSDKLGGQSNRNALLVRLHSECLTGDAFSSLRCDCGPQLNSALEKIAKEGRGLVIYLRQEGRGIGLINKIKAYALQDQGQDTVEANLNLGFDADQRNFDVAADFLKQLGINKIRLMTNNPKKVEALESAGIEITERVEMKVGKNPHNEHYLSTKHGKLGHFL
ncbi:MAG: GTP cyclohydrolase II [Gammaproteobacteria bacterium]|nr:MAG: GTP cyclohydrolase II [Gammaproteobacteria bacterium]